MSDNESVDVVDAPVESDAPEAAPVADDKPTPNSVDKAKRGLMAELLAERDARRKAEARVREFEDINKTEAEKAAARAEAAEKALEEMTAKAARLEVVTELGVPSDLAEFLTGSDPESLRAQAEKLMAATAAAKAPRTPQPDPSQGAKPGGSASQLTRADLAGMSPEAITTAKAEGRLNDLLGIKS